MRQGEMPAAMAVYDVVRMEAAGQPRAETFHARDLAWKEHRRQRDVRRRQQARRRRALRGF